MGVFDRVKTAIGEALLPQRAAENKELAYLRQIYENRDGGIRRNQWYRLLNQNGDHVGFSFSCACGQEYQLLNMTDWLGRQNICPTCKTEFDLLKTCGITADMSPSQWPPYFAKLPARPRLTGKSTPRYFDTWGDDDKGGGTPQSPAEKWAGGSRGDGWV